MTKSSSTNLPLNRRTPSLPMCIGRPMRFEPSRSASPRSPGPRSTVSVATIATASVTANTTTPSFVKRNAKCDRMRSKRLNLSGIVILCDLRSIRSTTSTAPVSTAAPGTTSTSFTTPSLGVRSSFSIFIASTTTTACLAVTWSPTATSTRTTRPGIGALTCMAPSHRSHLIAPVATGTPHRLHPVSASSSTTASYNLAAELHPDRAVLARGCSRISRAAPPSISDSVSASIHDASTTRRLPLIVTVNVPACSAGSTATFHGRPFTMTSTFIAAPPDARVAPRAISIVPDRFRAGFGLVPVSGASIVGAAVPPVRCRCAHNRRGDRRDLLRLVASRACLPRSPRAADPRTSCRTRPTRTRTRRPGRGRTRWSC